MKKQLFTLAFLLLCFGMQSIFAQVSLTAPSTPVVIDFTGYTAAGASPTPSVGQLDSKMFAIYGFSGGAGPTSFPDILYFNDTATVGDLARGTVTGFIPTVGGLYALNKNGNQTLWIQPTAADFTPGSIVMKVCNNSGSPLTDLIVNFDWMYGNDGQRSQKLTFDYALDTLAYTNIFNDTTLALRDSMYYTISKSHTISGLNVANNVCMYLRWGVDEKSGTGSRDEIGLDNISVSMLSGAITPNIAFATATATVNESAGTVTVNVQQSTALACDVEVSDMSLTATNGSDYSFTSPLTVSFDGISPTASFTVPITNDAIVEPTESIVLMLQNATNGCIVSTPDMINIDIIDDDTPILSFDSTTVTVSETAGSVNVTIGQTVLGACTVDVSVFNGTATNGADYTLTSPTTVSFDGITPTATLNIPLIDDTILEPNETVKIYITNAIGCNIATPDTMVINITSDDAPPIYPIGSVTTQDPTGTPDSVNVRCRLQGIVYGINYRLSNNGLQFCLKDATGSTWVFRNNATLGYTVTEGDEIIVGGQVQSFNGVTQMRLDSVRLISTGNPLVAPNTVVTMSEPDEAELTKIMMVKMVNPAQWTTGVGNGGFNIRVTNGGTALTDTFTVRIDNDADLYSMPAPTCEWFNITGLVTQFDPTSPYTSGYQLQPRRSSDIECLPSPDLAFATASDIVSENAGTVTVNVSITNVNPDPTDVTITATGTASNGTDYTLGSTTVSFPGNSTANVPVTITIVDDAIVESSETVVLTLTTPTNAATVSQGVYTLTIEDNDIIGVTPALAAGLVSVYPNPGTSSFVVKTDVKVNEILVRNTLGQVVLTSNTVNESISAEKLTKGIYMIQVMTDKGMWNTKWIKE